jgi:small-conductance mechanosensitive channel
MQQTIKHICIFLVFLVAAFLWDDARPTLESYARHLIPRGIRKGFVFATWATLLVAIWHLLYYYLGRISDRAIYITTLVVLVAAFLYYGLIRL